MSDDLVLMPEAQARRRLDGRRVRFSVLFPVGNVAGRGVLRVLRVRQCEDGAVELVCGYESYERLNSAAEVKSG